MDEHEVAKIDDTADTLPGNEDRILPVDRVGQRDQPSIMLICQNACVGWLISAF